MTDKVTGTEQSTINKLSDDLFKSLKNKEINQFKGLLQYTSINKKLLGLCLAKKDVNKDTLLHVAITLYQYLVVELLLDCWANINAQDENVEIPFFALRATDLLSYIKWL